MSEDLNIRSEPILGMYNKYKEGKFIVNRRYQRKLVWSLVEKQKFIDSLLRGFPVPLFLIVDCKEASGGTIYEILDGMQRLEAITSFIEGDFNVDGLYFNMSSTPITNKLVLEGQLEQKTPILDYESCNRLLGYPLPFSISQYVSTELVDETFRRINTGGVRLSMQEVRQAGSISNFSQLVRKCSTLIRGDVSHADIISLDKMKTISLTTDGVHGGIPIRKTFWNKSHVLTIESIQASRDEELIAHILLSILLRKNAKTSSSFLNMVYIVGSAEYQAVENEIQKYGFDNLYKLFYIVFDSIQKTIQKIPNNNFALHVFDGDYTKVSSAFQVVFLAFFEIMIKNNKEVKNYELLAASLKNISTQCMGRLNPRKKWLNDDRLQMVRAVCGVIEQNFVPRVGIDPSTMNMIESIENILTQSKTENICYDFKIGICGLSEVRQKVNYGALSKIIKTLIAMSNTNPGNNFVIMGVADNATDATSHGRLYSEKAKIYAGFHITGIGGEAKKHWGGMDKYQSAIREYIKQEPIEDNIKQLILSNIFVASYYDKDLIIFKLTRVNEPIKYDNKYFIREIASTTEVSNVFEFFKVFMDQNKTYPYNQI